ncbi:hypothetical protein OPT61_g5836 [Boeremia exigua]|uniref:Uncharacterized protein n=1 Tax=Boeremia exigua TaxID=749465 RepID=A0ACC2I8V2_9PLEO|nr:hypothetical protein OPT61_g5836 [Boeremia exigua]
MSLSPARAKDIRHVAYPGQPLESGQIRLIKILPGAWAEPVRCQLFNVQHESAQYQTLSYVWGSPKVPRMIVVDSRPYPTTINLESALRHIRERHPGGIVLWVDALCINQADTAERTSQVQLMGRIYSMCKKVIVFLGDRLDGVQMIDERPPTIADFAQLLDPENSLSEWQDKRDRCRDVDAFDVFQLLYELSNNVHLNKVSGLILKTPSTAFLQAENTPGERLRTCALFCEAQERQRTHLIECLRKMMHPPFTPWWNRIWVIQEVVVPPLIEAVYGAFSVPWEVFTLASRHLAKHSTQCCQEIYTRLPRDLRKVLDDFTQKVSGISELRTTQVKLGFPRIFHEPKVGSRSLLELLRRFRDRQASDSRDKVYALLSLVKTDEDSSVPSMLPDYSLSESRVFAQATLQCIYGSGSLSVFSTELGRKFRSDLPSWVPDWGAPGGYIYTVRGHAVELYNASPGGDLIEDLVRSTDLVRLRVRALTTLGFLGFSESRKVQSRGDTMWGDEASFCCATLANWWQHLSRETLKAESRRNVRNQFWKLVCGDVINKPQANNFVRRAGSRDELHFVTWSLRSFRSPFRDAPEDVHDALWSISANAYRIMLQFWPQPTASPFVRAAWCPESYLPQRKPKRYAVWEYGPHDSIEEQMVEQVMVKQLLHFLGPATAFNVSDLIDDAGHIREDGPWKKLYEHVASSLAELYSRDSIRFYTTADPISLIDNSIMTATLARCLIVIEGYVGLGPANTRIGDQICVLGGGKTPFVIRRRVDNQTRRDDQNEYELIGDCYIQDLMDGTPDSWNYWRDITLV